MKSKSVRASFHHCRERGEGEFLSHLDLYRHEIRLDYTAQRVDFDAGYKEYKLKKHEP
jgi:hypothetical protein